MKRFVVGACGALIAGTCGLSASGATLTGSVTTSVAAPVNLTNLGPVDWAVWDYQASGNGSTGAPSNRKLGGTTIGNASAAGTGTLRGITGTTPAPTYSYTNGTSPTSFSNTLIGALTEGPVNVQNSGVQVTVKGVPGTPETVRVFVTGFNAVGQLTATLNGATTYVDDSVSYAGTRFPAVYTLTFEPNSATDVLTIKYIAETLNTGGNSNVDLQAIAVAVPEPGSLAVLGLGVVGLMGRRRR